MTIKEAREKEILANSYALDNGFVHGGDVIKCPYCNSDKITQANIYKEDYWGEIIDVEYDWLCEDCNKNLGHYAYGNYEYNFIDYDETAIETISNLQEQLQQYKQQIDELIKKYEQKIINCTYSDIYTIEDDDFYVNGERLTQEFLDDLSKLKEVKK